MDESWRMRMGMPVEPPTKLPNNPPRRSTVTTSHRRTVSDNHPLSPEDFNDVFGGPPRSILSRQFSANLERSSSFLDEDIYRQHEKVAPAGIPVGKHRDCGFYGDVFRWDEGVNAVRSRSRWKTRLSPIRPTVSGDGCDGVSLLASKLRPINVKSSGSLTRMKHDQRPQNSSSNTVYNCEKDSFINTMNFGFTVYANPHLISPSSSPVSSD